MIRFLVTGLLLAAAWAHRSAPVVDLAWASAISLLVVEVGTAVAKWLR